jgi:acyl dehydratase
VSEVRLGNQERWASPGTAYPERTVVHDTAYQADRLRASDVDPALFGDWAEAGLFGLDCFDAMTALGLDIDGYVFLSQSYRQIAPVRVGERLLLSGHVRRLFEVNRGLVAHELYVLRRENGEVCLESELTGLLADGPDAESGSRGGALSLARREALPEDGWVLLKEKQVTPDKVRAFSQDVGNDIHFDEALARKHGFRAPLAQGIMSAVWLLSALAEERPPMRFNVNVRYLRPVFWDAKATMWTRRSADGSIEMVQSRDEDGKVTADMVVEYLTYDPHVVTR